MVDAVTIIQSQADLLAIPEEQAGGDAVAAGRQRLRDLPETLADRRATDLRPGEFTDQLVRALRETGAAASRPCSRR